MMQRGISGNTEKGCDAIIVSGLRADQLGKQDDKFSTFIYAAETNVGGGSLLTSFKKKFPIRVFRSCHLDNAYRYVASLATQASTYRYDGLYEIRSISGEGLTDINECTKLVVGVAYQFKMERKKPGDCCFTNNVSNNEVLRCSREGSKPTMDNRDILLFCEGGF